jgi:hypothetical protein
LPLRLFLDDDQGWAGLYFAHFIVFLKLHVRSGEATATSGRTKRMLRNLKLAWLPL